MCSPRHFGAVAKMFAPAFLVLLWALPNSVPGNMFRQSSTLEQATAGFTAGGTELGHADFRDAELGGSEFGDKREAPHVDAKVADFSDTKSSDTETSDTSISDTVINMTPCPLVPNSTVSSSTVLRSRTLGARSAFASGQRVGRPRSREAEDPARGFSGLRFCVGSFSRPCRRRRYATNLKKSGTCDCEKPRHVAYL